MANTLTVTVALDLEDRERIDRLITALECCTGIKAIEVAQDGTKPALHEIPRPDNGETFEPTTDESGITYEDMLAKVKELMKQKPGIKAKVQALAQEYAEKLSAIPDQSRPEFMRRLGEMGGQS